jgi:hypothetical protein
MQVVLQEYGVRGLWRGTGPTVVRLSFGAGINFVALEKLKHFMLDVLPHASGQLGYLQAAAVGGEQNVICQVQSHGVVLLVWFSDEVCCLLASVIHVLPHASGQLGYLQAAAVGGECGRVACFVTVKITQWEERPGCSAGAATCRGLDDLVRCDLLRLLASLMLAKHC